jgi:hypothetical protein
MFNVKTTKTYKKTDNVRLIISAKSDTNANTALVPATVKPLIVCDPNTVHHAKLVTPVIK